MNNQSMRASQNGFVSFEMFLLREIKRYESRKAFAVRIKPTDIHLSIKRHAHHY
jgi:hypothetical protein